MLRGGAQQQLLRSGTAAMVALAAVDETGTQVQMQGDVIAGAHAERQLARARMAGGEVRKHGAQGGRAQPLPLPARVNEKGTQPERGQREIVSGNAAPVRIDAVMADKDVITPDCHRIAVRAAREIGQCVSNHAHPDALCGTHPQVEQCRARGNSCRHDAEGDGWWHGHSDGGGDVPRLL